MHRSLMSLSILILAVVLIATSCSSSKENDSKTTTTGNESVIFLAKDCPEDTGFCANFPSSYEKKALQAHDPATSDEPAHTSYYTEVYPGEEIEQYVVKVYDDDPGGKNIQALISNYASPWWKCDVGTEIAPQTCTWRISEGTEPSVTVEMLVPGTGKLYVVQASTMSLNDPAYAGDFMRDFELHTP